MGSLRQSAEIICAIRRDHMCNSPRSYVQFAEIICAIRRDHSVGRSSRRARSDCDRWASSCVDPISLGTWQCSEEWMEIRCATAVPRQVMYEDPTLSYLSQGSW